MTTITPEDLWEAVNRDEGFAKYPDNVKEFLRPFVEALPEVLKETWDQKVTYITLIRSRELFLHYCINNHLLRKMALLVPYRLFGAHDPWHFSVQVQTIILTLIADAQQLLKDPQTVLKYTERTLGLTERDLVRSGLAGELKGLYDEGSLTIGHLVTNNPCAVIHIGSQEG